MARKSSKINNQFTFKGKNKGRVDKDDIFNLFNDGMNNESTRKSGVIKKLSRSFGEGIKSEFNSSILRDKLDEVMPSGYKDVVEVFDALSDTPTVLYNTIFQETRQPMKYFKRSVARLLKREGEDVPKGIRGKLTKMLGNMDDEPGSSGHKRNKSADERSSIESSLGNIFKAQVEVDQERINEQRSREIIKDSVEKKRFEGNMGQLLAIRMGINRQVTYQDQITSKVQRKALELQYRQLFVSTDTKNILEKVGIDVREALKAIVINTGLSDFNKLNSLERVGENLKKEINW